MSKRSAEILGTFPQVDEAKLDRRLAEALGNSDHKIVVLDDDPTGVQTVHGVSVYTSWDKAAIRAGFAEESRVFFVLTNSRGLTREETTAVHRDIARTLCEVAAETGRDYILVSRSDSTMRGHFPLETETLRETIEAQSDLRFDGEIIFPFFKEGGRFTIDNIHYVQEGDSLIPAGETEFARDKSFGYRSSHLGGYVEEKTGGRYTKDNCTYISLPDLRAQKLDKIAEQLIKCTGFNKVIVSAVDYVDVKVFALSYCQALRAGKRFLFRSAAAVPKVLGGISTIPLLTKGDLIDPTNENGGIVLVGSHVNKTTQQLEALRRSAKPISFIEFNQHLVVSESGLAPEVARVVALAEENIKAGKTVAIYTRRDRFDLPTKDKDRQLKTSVQISDAVTGIIGSLTVRPNFIIAKGGITSSDVGTKALRVRKAVVMGQISPGIPVWMTGPESKFPNMPYIIFPGNVGQIGTLKEIIESLM